MERVGLIAAFEAAIRRGAGIDIFADPLLNVGPAAGGLTQMEAVEKVFAKIGARLHKRPQLHSKIVAIDSDLPPEKRGPFCVWWAADAPRAPG